MFASIVCAISAGLLDRIRGGWPQGRPSWLAHVATFFAGVLSVLAVGVYDPIAIAAGGLMVGELSWRQDNGWRGNWVRKDEGMSIVAPLKWGAIWCAPLVLLGLFFGMPLLSYAIAAPAGALVAIWISTKLPPKEVFDLRHAWPWSELIELPIIIVIAALISAALGG